MSTHLRRRRRTISGLPSLAIPFALILVVATGCASTTYDETLATSDTDVVATTTTLPTGSAAELLPLLRDEAASLAGVMIVEGDDRAVADRIVALWDAVSKEVGSTRPDLVDSFGDNVALVQKAVQFDRAADADKASRNFGALVEAFLGS